MTLTYYFIPNEYVIVIKIDQNDYYSTRYKLSTDSENYYTELGYKFEH